MHGTVQTYGAAPYEITQKETLICWDDLGASPQNKVFSNSAWNQCYPGCQAWNHRFLYRVFRLLEILDDNVSVDVGQYGTRYDRERETNEDVTQGNACCWVDLLEFLGSKKYS